MNPNQHGGFQPYTGQFKNTQYNNFQFSNQPSYNQNTLNVPHSHNYNQGGSLSPNDNHQLNRGKLDRAMYSSTIQPTMANKNFTFGKLQGMGRFVNTAQQAKNQPPKFNHQFNHSFGQQKDFGFQQSRQSKTYQSNNVNNSNNNEFDRFPAFNLHEKPNHQPSFSNNTHNQHVNQQEQKPQTVIQTPQQKRRRQILAIKQELELINKKMESSKLNTKYHGQQQKNDTKVYQNSTINNSNESLNVQNLNTNSFSNQPSQNQNSFNEGLNFTKGNQLNVGLQRNKGLATQSMIVSNQPSPGYKYQSIFDKYDTLKKPTYQIQSTQAVKQDRPSLLDKFVNKGPGFQQLNKQKQTEISQHNKDYFTNSNTSNSNSNVSSNAFDINSYLPKTSTNQSNYNFKSNYSSSTSSSQGTTNSTNLAQGINNESYNHTFEAPKQTGGMFKKKKQNPYIQQVKNQYFPTSPKNSQPISQEVVFKKNKNPTYQDNMVTNAMKNMNIQQSVQFKKEDFVVGKKLGKGQFGEVMLVQHKKTGFLCGMKVMQKKQIRDQKYEGQIARQLSIQFYLAHRNIAPLYGYFQDEKNVYLLVQYCTGGQLLELLRKNRRMQEPQVSRIIRQIIEGIDYIHKELIIHRDIKPQNILFNFGVAKICDFGWAVYKGHGMRKTASVGSPLYYSPQIVMGVEYDQKIDIWDIGMMTYQCLLGKIPFRIYSQLDLNRIVQDEIKFPEYIDTTEEAKDFILKIMKKKPQQRMEIRQMLRHPFITKYPDPKLPIQIMKDFKEVLNA